MEKEVEYYNINSMYKLKNGYLISCNSYGIKLYEKINGKYELKQKKKIGEEIRKVIKDKIIF